MNDQLTKLITDTETELAQLKVQLDPLEAEHEKLDDDMAPLLNRQGVLEEQIAGLFPRKVELEHQLEHLRKINTDFALDKRAKPAEESVPTAE